MADWLTGVFEDHVRAWTALADAAAGVAGLPVRTAQRLVLPGTLAAPEAPAEEPRVAELSARLAASEAAHAGEIAALKGAYGRLEADAAARAGQAEEDQKLLLYKRLEPLLAQLPAVRHAVGQGREVAASDLLDLLGPLDEAMDALGFAAIGAVGEVAPYDPALHQAAPAPEAGAPVTVKTPGYRLGEKVLRRARVSGS